MENDAILKGYTPLELMLKWNRYCDAHNREADCIPLCEPLTFDDLNDGDELKTMKEILNSDSPEFRRDEGFLVPVYESKRYVGLKYVPIERIGDYIDLKLLEL
jgi:hypothetical protein